MTRTPGLATFTPHVFKIPLRLKTARKRWCDTCKIVRPNFTKHCHYCDVCFLDWDHHCPWTTKCIAKRNLCVFYVFVSSVFIFFMVILAAFIDLSSDGTPN